MYDYAHTNSFLAFQVYLINRTVSVEALEDQGRALVRSQFRPVLRAVLCGIAGGSPTSTAQNLVDLLLALITRCPNEARAWVPEILFSVCCLMAIPFS